MGERVLTNSRDEEIANVREQSNSDALNMATENIGVLPMNTHPPNLDEQNESLP